MAGTDDILSAQKNGVAALGNLYNLQRRVAGTVTSATVSATTLIATGRGRLVSYTLVAPGSADGMIHNSASTGGIAAANALVPTNHSATGVIACGLEFMDGLVVAPGSGQSINVTYTLG